MKHLFNVLILVIALCSCSNDGNNKDNHSLVSGGEVYHIKSNSMSSKHLSNDSYGYEGSTQNETHSDVTHDIYLHKNTGVIEIKGPKINTKIHVVDKIRGEKSKGSYRFMSIDDSKMGDSGILFTYIDFHYEFNGDDIRLDNKNAGILLITINKDDTVDISTLYLPFESFYTYRRMIMEVNNTSTNSWY